ncbi:MAG: hypothetical protein JSW18_00410 [Candidatus Omnitrophota bacterium]|nr:MAG: hypothetical protein JSW18_00410 [Candidatus Omnitrophota bacterium]
MIKKEELLKLLSRCLDAEEKGIPIYSRHLGNTLFLSDFKKEEQKKVRDTLETLKTDSETHKTIFEDLIKRIKGSTKDVY